MGFSLRRAAACGVALAAAGLWAVLPALNSDRGAALTAGAAALGGVAALLRGLRLPWLSPAVLYLSVFEFFHLGLAVPWALGLPVGRLPHWFVTSRLVDALALVVLAIGFYLAGVLWAGRGCDLAGPARRFTNPTLFAAGVVLYLAGGAMFLAGMAPLGGARFLDAGYAETYRLTAQFDPRLFGTSFTVTPLGLYLAAASFSRRQLPAVLAMTSVWVAAIFYLGFRGYALISGLVVLSLLGARGFRIPRWAGGLLVAAVLTAIPAVRAVRDTGARQRSLDGVWDRIQPLDGVAEMGGSLRPLVHTLRYLETECPRWGRTYWQSLSTVIPNLALEWQGARYIPLDELPPNHWLTIQAEPGMYRQYGGLGFSAVAEPYMNFGAAGVAVYFALLGLVLGRAPWRPPARPSVLALWAVMLGPLLWTTRNSFEIFFRPAVWGALAVVAAGLARRLLRSAALPSCRIRYARPGGQ